KNILFVGLIVVDGGGAVAGLALKRRRDDLLGGRKLRDHRLEAREEQRRDIERALGIEPPDLAGDAFGIDKADRAHRAQLDVLDDLLLVLALELVIAFAADTEKFHVLAGSHE